MGGRTLPLGGVKQRALLAVLLLDANRVVPRDRLVDDLWGESPPEAAVATVQVYVSRLRKLLPEGTLTTQPPGYLLTVGASALDLREFERLVEEARGAEAERAAAALREALELWRGPPLAEFEDEPFARVERRRLDDLRLAALEDRLEADLALGRHAELVGELEALVVQHPHRERLRAALMLSLYRSGRQAEALDAYRGARGALDELGLEPGVALRRLEKRILTQDAALDLLPERLLAVERVVLPGPLVPTSPFPFVGRAAELAVLRDALVRAESGEGRVVLLPGEGGGGKTRLIRELAHDMAGDGVLVLYGTSDAAVVTPYQPVREWLGFLLRVSDPDTLRECLGPHGAELARLVPELSHLTGSSSAVGDRPELDRFALQGAALELLTRLSRIQPLLLVLDDVQWADGETLQLLRRLARGAPEARWLVVVAYRTERAGGEFVDAVADLSRLEGVARLPIGSLTSAEMGAFIQASVDVEGTPELVAALGELTDGTPLLLCELWRNLRESGDIEVSDVVRLTRPIAELRGSERLSEVVHPRLARLAPQTASLVEVASVAGTRFELRVVADAAGLDQAALVAAIEEATATGLIEELPDPAPFCRFSHELVRRVVYDRISRIRRPELHLRIAEGLERAHAADPKRVLPELAHHFTLGAAVAGVERAVHYNLEAGQAAVAAAAFTEAAARLQTALDLGIPDPRKHVQVRVELALLLAETGRFAEAEPILAESLEAAAALGERGVVARILLSRAMASMWDVNADPEHTRAVAEEAVETFRQLGDLRGVADAERHVGHGLRRQGHGAAAGAAFERALAAADASGDKHARLLAIGALAHSLWEGPAPAADAIRRCEELLQMCRNDPPLEATIARCASALYAMAGRLEEARESVRRSGVVLDELNHLTVSWVYRSSAAEARELIGDRDGAEQELMAKWLWLDRLGSGSYRARAMQAAYELAHLYGDDGRWDDAERCLAYGLDFPEPIRYRRETVLGLAGRARLAAYQGALADAKRLARHGVELADQSDMLNVRARAWLAFAEVERACGRGAGAESALAAALALYARKGNVTAAARASAQVEAVAAGPISD